MAKLIDCTEALELELKVVKKAQEALQKAEAIMRGEKVEWVD